MKKYFFVLQVFVLLIGLSGINLAQTIDSDTLLKNFLTPPNDAKPRVWWHWMNGNITKDGIAKDLAWMKRAGLGGFQNFDAALSTPQIVAKRLIYMTPEWKDAFQFTARLADSLHLEMAIAGSPGWSESGGPWVKPEDGMKKIVWSETRVEGGKRIVEIPKPPSVTGPFQNFPTNEFAGLGDQASASPPEYYHDVALVAYKLPASDHSLKEINPKVTSSGGNFDLSQLTDGDVAKTSLLPSDTIHGFAWIQFEFAQPQTIKAVTIVGGGDRGPFGMNGDFKDTRSIEASDNGKSFHRICYIPAGNLIQQTITIPATTATFFRITFKNPPTPFNFGSMVGGSADKPKPPAGTEIAEIVLHTVTRINRFEEKSAFAPSTDLSTHTTPTTDDVIAASDVIDLTDKMTADGKLNWTAPAGRWNIVRFGYSLLGITNHPASPEATGLEVDKLDAAAIKRYFENYLDQYKNATGGMMGKNGGLQFMVTDSWEAGAQNWTPNMLKEFEKRRGYTMVPWMPVLTGHVIKNAEASENFLWDFRKTLSELVAEYHYDQLTDILQQYGMKRYSESHESGRALIADGMDVKRKAFVPMSAMWVPNVLSGERTTGYEADIRESASVAHIYGQNLVAAESLTAFGLGGNAWSYSPENLKPTADLELANGLNRFVIHTSVHQPTDDKIPGLGLGPFGQWFTRHETWAEQAKVWTSYLSRSAYMLQQGKCVADIIYYYGEDNNITSLFGQKLPAIPEGYNYDFVNSDAILNQLSVKNNLIITPSGMHYTVLALDSNSMQMTLPVLRKIYALVKDGASVVGPKPTGSPSLSDDKTEYSSLVNTLWKEANGVNAIGNGKVFSGQTIAEVLGKLKISPDFTYTKHDAKSSLLYVHRTLPQQEIYWINNRSNTEENIEASFRISGKNVEIWHPETGSQEQPSYSFADGRTTVSLHLDPNDAFFIVFRGNTSKTSRTAVKKNETLLSSIEGPWNLSFQNDLGAPAPISLDKLSSWTENKNTEIEYFSGTGIYTKKITCPSAWFKKDSRLWIDLGEVKNLAEVIVNGKSLGIAWKRPFRLELTNVLKPGENTLEIKVINLWVNRLIGDLQPGITKKYTYTTMPFYRANSPLLPSGLLGPVGIIAEE